MRHPTWCATLFLVLFLITGCSADDTSTEDTVAATEPPASTTGTLTAPTTTAPTTTTTGAEGPVVDEALAHAFVASIRERWARAERAFNGSAPDLSDDEIVAVGAAMCEYMAANPWMLDIENEDPEETMPVFTELAAVAADAMGIKYDPTMQDAGFDNGFEAGLVSAFRSIAGDPDAAPLCPGGPYLFHSPWTARASE